MTSENIYADLTNIDLGDKVTQLEEQNRTLLNNINILQNDVQRLCEELTQMKKTESVLKNNISELFATAKLEIERKDRMITELRTKLDDLIFKRRNRQDHSNTASDICRKRKTDDVIEPNKRPRQDSHNEQGSHKTEGKSNNSTIRSRSRSVLRERSASSATRRGRSRSPHKYRKEEPTRHRSRSSKRSHYHSRHDSRSRHDKYSSSKSRNRSKDSSKSRKHEKHGSDKRDSSKSTFISSKTDIKSENDCFQKHITILCENGIKKEVCDASLGSSLDNSKVVIKSEPKDPNNINGENEHITKNILFDKHKIKTQNEKKANIPSESVGDAKVKHKEIDVKNENGSLELNSCGVQHQIVNGTNKPTSPNNRTKTLKVERENHFTSRKGIESKNILVSKSPGLDKKESYDNNCSSEISMLRRRRRCIVQLET